MAKEKDAAMTEKIREDYRLMMEEASARHAAEMSELKQRTAIEKACFARS